MGNGNLQPLCDIAVVFALERMRIVFRMAGYENLPPVAGDGDIDTGLGRFADDLKSWIFLELFSADPGMPGVRCPENIIETTGQLRGFIRDIVLEYAEHLGGQLVLGDPIVVIQPGLRAPADMEGGKDVLFA